MLPPLPSASMFVARIEFESEFEFEFEFELPMQSDISVTVAVAVAVSERLAVALVTAPQRVGRAQRRTDSAPKRHAKRTLADWP